jgi:hypothetical protein
VEPAASEGATLGLGPELAMTTLRGLLRDAERLGDETLADAVTVHLNQFALVMAQQGGPLSELAGGVRPAASAKVPAPASQPAATEKPVTAPDDKPAKQQATDETPKSTADLAADGRRHQR